MKSFVALSAVAAFAPLIEAHGYVAGIVAGGVSYGGYNPSYMYSNPPPKVAGWTTNDLDNGFVSPDAFATNDITCHKNATAGKAFVTVAAGDKVELQWNTWPSSHHGPVINYLARCPGDCTAVDKTTLNFFKIQAGGLESGSNPGTWATDDLIANNNTGVVTIPKNLKPGGYVLRHEIIALHSAGQSNGAQAYPQCINLKVTGSGTDLPSTGTKGTALYKPTDAGILINIYQTLTSYTMPGPAIPSMFSSAASKVKRAFVA
ncbi:hypothetical protein MBLNU457_7180t1 [Dothideomycetes sp. NU457]